MRIGDAGEAVESLTALPGSDQVLELGIFAKTFRKPSVEELLDTIAGHGLTCTQWNWACVPGFSSLPKKVPVETTRRVIRAANGSGVRICAVSATFNLIQPAACELGLSRLPALADAAVEVGCHLLTLCTGTRHPTDMWAYHPGNDSQEAWDEMLKGLSLAIAIARDCGVRLAIEPETANVVCDALAAERAIQQLDPDGEILSIILDAANLYRPPADPRKDFGIIDDAATRLGKHLSLTHAKDIADPYATGDADQMLDHYKHVAAGAGILPYPQYVAAIKRTPAANGNAKWRLPLVLHGLEENEVAASVAFVREAMRADALA